MPGPGQRHAQLVAVAAEPPAHGGGEPLAELVVLVGLEHQHPVGQREDGAGGVVHQGGGAHGVADAARVHRGLDTLAGHVAAQQHQVVWAFGVVEHVEEVAADGLGLVGHAHVGGDLQAGDLGHPARGQRAAQHVGDVPALGDQQGGVEPDPDPLGQVGQEGLRAGEVAAPVAAHDQRAQRATAGDQRQHGQQLDLAELEAGGEVVVDDHRAQRLTPRGAGAR